MRAKNAPTLITGCQRTGTTLVYLILDSHPHITGVDEIDFSPHLIKTYLTANEYHPNVALKLPQYASSMDFIKSIPSLTTLWCIRDPRDVVVSMTRLQLKLRPTGSVSWAVHPRGGPLAIKNALSTLGRETRRQLRDQIDKLERILGKPLSARSRADAVYVGALCWRVRNELLQVYDREKVSYRKVVYEELIEDPRKEVGEILDFLDLPWDEQVLQHHLFHQGVSIGGTDTSRAIDPNNTGKWKGDLSEGELSCIAELCSPIASNMGYSL